MARRIGVVLAGGLGRRMGRSKGDLLLSGSSLATRAALRLSRACDEVVISVRPGSTNPAPEFRTVADEEPVGRGPLAGIDAAFRSFPDADLVVLACDYPRVSEPLVRAITAAGKRGTDVVFPRDPAGQDHPLVAWWGRTSAFEVSRALVADRLAVREILESLRVLRLTAADLPGVDLAVELVNWNEPEDREAPTLG